MIRGAQKQMIVVRTRNSRVFEEAYFVIRRNAGRGETDETDMLWEANRIIENSLPNTTYAKERPISNTPAEKCDTRRTSIRFNLIAGLVWFAMGFLSGGGLIGLLWWLL